MKEVFIKIKKHSKVNENGETVSEYLLMAQDNEGKITPLIRMDKEGLQAYARFISEYAENERKEGGAQ